MEYWWPTSLHYSSTPLLQLSSSNTEAALALFEKGTQLREVILAGLQSNRIDVVSAQHARKLVLALVDKPANPRSCGAIRSVDLNLIAGLSVFQGDDADIWQNSLSFVMNMDGDEIVSPSTYRQSSRKIGRLEIRNEEHHGAARDNLGQIIEGQRRFRAASLWFEEQNFSDKSQRMRAAFLWWNKKLDAIGEKNQANLVIVPNCTESEQACDFRRQFAF